MDTLVQQTVNGLMLGSIYALIALGYTMVYGILRIINFAHGDVLMVGALSALSAIGVLQHHFPALPPYATLLLAACSPWLSAPSPRWRSSAWPIAGCVMRRACTR